MEFLLEHDKTIGKWTDEEKFVLMEHVMQTPDILTSNALSESINNLVLEYNNSAAKAAKFGLHHVCQKEKSKEKVN